MPAGIPVGTLAIGKPGAINAALLAASVLSLSDETISNDSMLGAKNAQIWLPSNLQTRNDKTSLPPSLWQCAGTGNWTAIRMLSLAGAQLGFKTHIYGPEENAPAQSLMATTTADYRDETALRISLNPWMW